MTKYRYVGGIKYKLGDYIFEGNPNKILIKEQHTSFLETKKNSSLDSYLGEGGRCTIKYIFELKDVKLISNVTGEYTWYEGRCYREKDNHNLNLYGIYECVEIKEPEFGPSYD